ncbi:MAG: hypothetical protein ACQET6_19730 [Bacillota bacterium]|uniref:hypothetical protein n=1 Tax=Rossellomorea sp. FM04394 TaxID=3243076 RepID=UPI0035A72220
MAEMGVEYLEGEVRNVLEENKSRIVNVVQDEIEKDKSEGFNKLPEYYRKKALIELKRVIDQEIANSKLIQMDDNRPEIFFEITRKPSFPGNGDLKIPYTSKGADEGKTSQLYGEIIIPIEGISGDGELEPAFNQIDRPENGPGVCIDPDSIPENCQELLLTKDMKYSKGVKNLKLIYADSGVVLTIDEVMNHSERMSIHVDGILRFNKNMKHINNLTMEVNGELEFDDHLDVTDSSIFLKGPLTIDKHLSLKGTSTLYVLGNLDLNGKLDINRDSKVCVKGNVEIDKKNNAIGNVYYTGIYTEGKSKGPNTENIKRLDINEFKEVCGSGYTTDDVSIKWGDITKTVNY